VALAQAGRSIIVVDTDLHRPRQHRLFGVPNGAGVTTALLQGQPSLDGLLQQGPLPNLRILTSGPLPPNAAELLGSEPMHKLLAMLAQEADVVVFDSPPMVALSDTAVLATQVDGVLLVLDSGSTRRDVAKRAVLALQQVNATCWRAVQPHADAAPDITTITTTTTARGRRAVATAGRRMDGRAMDGGSLAKRGQSRHRRPAARGRASYRAGARPGGPFRWRPGFLSGF
jgi:capsular exopolysaccharide synthesis family protein